MSPVETHPMFRPPINRGMRVLDRAFFHKEIPLAAARISNTRLIAQLRTDLDRSGTSLLLGRVKPLRPDPDQALAAQGRKCYLLKPEIKHDG